jgi:hypothetical protein
MVLEQLDDIKLDAPLAPKVVGQFMGSALLDNYLDASFVMPALKPLVESGSAITVLVGLFNFYIENTVRHPLPSLFLSLLLTLSAHSEHR